MLCRIEEGTIKPRQKIMFMSNKREYEVAEVGVFAPKARGKTELIAGEVQKYWEWVAGLSAVPVLTEMRARMESVREREVADALKRLRHLPPAEQAVVEELSRSLMNKFLHEPTVRLRAAASNGRGLGIVDAVRYLFGLHTAPDAKDRQE